MSVSMTYGIPLLASLLRGAKPKVISEALGHSSVAFTMDVYSHIIEGMQQDAMILLDGVLPKAKNEVS
jgi:integrase